MSALPWGKFFWRDWMTELTLRGCSLAARGLWMDMLCIAAQHEPPGYVAVNGRALDGDALAKLIGADKAEVNLLLVELDKAGVYSRDEGMGMIYSRRMVADHAKHVKAVTNGKKGGNPSLGNYEGKERSVNHLDKPPHKPPVKVVDNTKVIAKVIEVDNSSVKHRGQSTEVRDQKDKNQNPTASAESVAPRAPAKAIVDPKIMDLKVGIVAAYEHANILGTPDTAIVEEWFVSIPSFSPDLALASIKSQLSTMGKPTFKQLTYFEPRVRQKHEERFGTAGGAVPGQVASSRTKLVAREDAVCEGDKPMPDQTAYNMIDLWERGGPWAPPLGMRPDQRGCRVPMDILQARGYRDEHGRMSDRYLELRAEARAKRDLVRNSLEPIPKAATNGGATH